MLGATVIITVLYATFIFSYTELACAIPRAGGAFDFGLRAFGPYGGLLLGIAQLIEFLFAPPAIAAAIGAYFSLFFPNAPVKGIAIFAYVIFTGVNIWGVKQAAVFELLVTIAAIGELLLFMGVTVPHFQLSNLTLNALPHGWMGIFACLPFAVWFYLGIEGIANAAEEARNPRRDIALSFPIAILTLIILALGIFFTSIGVAGWEAVVYPTPGAPPSDSPLPLALGKIVGGTGWLYHLLITVGLFGLVASFHGIVLAAGRATMELGRKGYAPCRSAASTSALERRSTPSWPTWPSAWPPSSPAAPRSSSCCRCSARWRSTRCRWWRCSSCAEKSRTCPDRSGPWPIRSFPPPRSPSRCCHSPP